MSNPSGMVLTYDPSSEMSSASDWPLREGIVRGWLGLPDGREVPVIALVDGDGVVTFEVAG